MPNAPLSRGLLLTSLTCCVILGWAFGFPHSRGTEVSAIKQAEKKPTPLYFGASACAKCHNEKEPFKDEKLPPVCRCTEMQYWTEKDKHKDAFLALTGDRAKHMSRLLGLADKNGRPGVASSPQCLSCHAINVEKKEWEDSTFKIEDGVSCVSCHGAFEEWIDEHGSATGRKRERFRDLSREAKESVKGMRDLWDPAKRTQLCVSCHVGNAAEGKVVTHDMYAAGHPPLPSFEIVTFCEEMPRHWQLLREKTKLQQDLLRVRDKEMRFENTKLILISANASLEAALNLLAAEAKSPEWPDYAQFDCYACHHDLQTPSWRQERGYKGRPGRVQPRPWPTELARVTSRLLGEKDSQFDEEVKPLYEVFDKKPFGDPQDVKDTASAQAGLARKRAEKVAKLEVNEATALRLLHALCEQAGKAADYDSARQIVWSFKAIYDELLEEAKKSGVQKEALEKTASQVQQVLKELETGMRLKLPSGQKQDILKELNNNLKALYDYKPADFKAAFLKLQGYLPPAGKS